MAICLQRNKRYFWPIIEHLLFYVLIFKYDSIKKLANLEKIKLIEWPPENEVKVLGGRKYAHTSGPLFTKHTNRILAQFIKDSFTSESKNSFGSLINLSEGAQKKFEIKMEELMKEIKKEMEMERMLKIPTNLLSVYLGIGSIDFIYDELRSFKS